MDFNGVVATDGSAIGFFDKTILTSLSSSLLFIILSTSTQEPNVPQRIHYVLAKNHPVDQIMGDISNGVQTRSRIASFCEHYSFVSFLEPNY